MFYILVIIGIVFIVLGSLFKNKLDSSGEDSGFIDEVVRNDEFERAKKKKGNLELETRIAKLEKLLFEKTLEEEEGKEALGTNKVIHQARNEDYLERYKMVRRYEGQGKSLDEIARLLDMNKGEILLLKNIYKEY